MSGSGDLTAKLILTGDNKSIVTAGEGTVVVLDQVKRSATEAGAAAAGASAAFDASAVALKGHTEAAAMYTAAVTASGEAQRGEVSRLMEKAAASESVIGKVRALSAAHAEYNGTVAQARSLLAQGIMTEAQYGEAVAAATAKLALARAAQEGSTAAIVTEAEAAKAIGAALGAMGTGATVAGNSLDNLEAKLAKLGRFGGVSKGVISRTRAGLSAIPDLIEAFPVASAAGGAAAAIAVLIAAEQSYETSIGRLNITLQAHGLALSTTSDRYLALATDIASTGNVSTRAAREMESAFANAHIDPSLWQNVAAMSRDYAAVLGSSVPEAAAKAAEELQKPYEWAVKLTEQYGLFNQATLQHIHDLELSGRTQDAQKIVTAAWAARIKNAADETSGWARAWGWVARNASDAWDAIGHGLFGSKAEELQLKLKNAQSDLDWRLNAKKSGYKMANLDDQIAYYQRLVDGLKKELASVDGTTEKRNSEANSLSAMVGSMGLSSYDQTLRDLGSKRQRVIDDYNKGIKATVTGPDGKTADLTKEQALARVDTEITKTKKERAEAERNLNEVEKQHYERIQELIKGAPDLIAQSTLEANAATGRVKAYLQGTSALQAFNDQEEITKATLPYTTAMTYADEASKAKLANTIARVTAEKRKQLAADNALKAMQDVDQQVGSASGYMSSALADAKLALGRKQLDDWYTSTAASLQASGESWEQYHGKLDLIMGQRLAALYDDDLRNRTDWASGIARANAELTRSQADWATTTEHFITDWASAGEDAFVRLNQSGKQSIADLASFVEQEFMRMAYKRYLASSVNSVGNMLLSGIDNIFSALGGGSGSNVVPAGQHHDGGIAGYASVTRYVPAALFFGAPRYHGGTDKVRLADYLQPGEVPAVLKQNERVQTEAQAATTDKMVAYANAMMHQPVIELSPRIAAASAPAPVEMHFHEAPGIKIKTQDKQLPNGGRQVDVFPQMVRELEEALSDRVVTGQSSLAKTFEATHNFTRVAR